MWSILQACKTCLYYTCRRSWDPSKILKMVCAEIESETTFTEFVKHDG